MSLQEQDDQDDQNLTAGAEEQSVYEFEEDFQTKVIALMARDTTFAMRAKDIVKAEYFSTEAMSAIANVLISHITQYKSAPGFNTVPQLIKDAFLAKRIRKDLVQDVKDLYREVTAADLSGAAFVGDKVAEFARHQAMMSAIEASITLLDKGDFAAIEKQMKAALAVGVNNDGGDYDYWGEAENRAQIRHDLKSGKILRRGITSGYAEIDARLYHNGWGRQELSVIMGAAKAGKSMSLGDFTNNASLAGFTTFYGSLEVSKMIISDRLDACNADTLIAQLHNDPDEVLRRLKLLRAKASPIKMRDFPSGTLKPSQLHRVIEEYRNDGIIFDLITIDYADIMAAEYRSDKLIDNLREIYIDLRAIAHEFDAALLTATQTNRTGATKVTADATDVGDDWNKVRTADILIGINATQDEKRVGEARLTWLISRNTKDGFSLRVKQDRSKMKFITKVIGEE